MGLTQRRAHRVKEIAAEKTLQYLQTLVSLIKCSN